MAATGIQAGKTRRLWVWVPAAVLGAALLFWAGASWRARAASAEIRSLALLPLVDAAAEQPADWFSSGITGGIIDAMSHIPGLQVAAQTSAFAMRAQSADIAAIGRRLGVAAVVEGTMVHVGDRLKIQMQMTRSADGFHLWSQTFEQPAQEAVGLPLKIAGAMALRLQVRLDPASFPHHRPSQEAYDAYLQGRSLLAADLDKSVEHLEQATGADPNFAQAWAWLSIARAYRVTTGQAHSNQAMPAARDAAERAVALDAACGDAHLALGIVKLQYDWDWAGAKEELDRALQNIPGSAFALQWHARWQETQGHLDAATVEMQRALALDPLSPTLLKDVTDLYVYSNQPDRAILFAQKAVDAQPGTVDPLVRLAEVLFLSGQKEKSQQIVQQLRANAGGAIVPAVALAIFAAEAGDPAPARQLMDEAEDLPDDQILPAIYYARVAAAVQDWDRMFAWLAEAVGQRDADLPYFRWNPLIPKGDPRYVDFLAQLSLRAPAAPATR